MEKLSNVYEQMSSFANLEQAYRHARKQKRYRNEILVFSNDLDSNLLWIQEEMRKGTFQFGPYRRHWVYVPKKRMVMSLPFDSRIVQWSIYLTLNPFYDKMFIEDSFACRKDKGSLKAARSLQYAMLKAENKPGNWYVLKLDISKYFYRVDHKVLLDILAKRIDDPQLMNLLRIIIDSDGEKFGLPRFTSAEDVEAEQWLGDVGMPIGNLTSQLFANIYLNELDQFCKHILKIRIYKRYMDDVVILASTKELAQFYKEEIDRFLMEHLHLDLNAKTQIKPLDGRGIEFVGYIVTTKHAKTKKVKISSAGWRNGKPYQETKTKYILSDGGLLLRKQTARRIKASFKGICRKYFNGELTKSEFDRRIASYDGIMQHCDTQKLENRLNEIYLHAKEEADKNGWRKCCNCEYFRLDYFYGIQIRECDKYGSLEGDQKARHPDTAAINCDYYKTRRWRAEKVSNLEMIETLCGIVDKQNHIIRE
ncbi:MAG: reverse transcriptase/maturase family protein [Lachnospiraceae bacterium]|nr:reverse transcriptase/maturase family protein [Lachnospiraceae bacterium]